jgi:NAD(P)-dependent dehydrogenase (short-subunit alcohol dehydrogenase family)
MFHQSIALESSLPGIHNTHGMPIDSSKNLMNIRVLNYAPGPLDTAMQSQIRHQMPNVPLRDTFVDMHQQKALVDPNVSAQALMSLLEKDEFVNGSHVDYFDLI